MHLGLGNKELDVVLMRLHELAWLAAEAVNEAELKATLAARL